MPIYLGGVFVPEEFIYSCACLVFCVNHELIAWCDRILSDEITARNYACVVEDCLADGIDRADGK